jgi:hypothetical protein
MSDERISAEARPLEEQLVAYLDGELDAEENRRVEELLATDAAVRETLQRLDRTWQMLEELEPAELGEVFTRTTLEMVTLREADAARARQLEAPRRRRRRRLIVSAGFLSVFLAGFLAVKWFWPDPNAGLVRDLEVIQHIDEYRETDDIEFLKMLSNEGLLTQGPADEEVGDGTR